MKNLGLAFLSFFFSSGVQAQMNPVDIVQANLDAYNQRNINLFMSFVHPQVELFEFQENQPTAKGLEEVKRRYQNLFEKSPKLNSQVVNRIVLGNKVIDHEVIAGRMNDPKSTELVVVYEVVDQAIKKILVIRK